MSKAKVAGYIVVGLLGAAALKGASMAYTYFTAPVKGIVEAEQIINDGQNRINEYEYFFDMCSTIQSDKQALDTQRRLLENAESADERERVRSNIAGIEAQLHRNVNQYNADSTKEYTAARFKDNSLPYTISAEQEFISCK